MHYYGSVCGNECMSLVSHSTLGLVEEVLEGAASPPTTMHRYAMMQTPTDLGRGGWRGWYSQYSVVVVGGLPPIANHFLCLPLRTTTPQ